MSPSKPFKWKHFRPEVSLLTVRWYLRYPLSYRQVEEMMIERGWPVDHTTIHRWVLQFGPELDKRCRPHLKLTTDSWKVDETYIKVGGTWQYLYRTVDSDGQTLDFFLSPRRDAVSAECFLRKALRSEHPTPPRVINTDKNPAYSKAVADLQANGRLGASTTLRQVKYLNNLIEQDHRFIKRLSKPGLGFKSWQLHGGRYVDMKV